jgi:hypothetical protein
VNHEGLSIVTTGRGSSDTSPSGKLLPRLEILESSTIKISFNSVDHFVRRDKRHAARKAFDDIEAKVVRSIPFVSISEWRNAAAPTASRLATGERARRMKVLMIGISLPMRWFPAASNYDTRPSAGWNIFTRDGGRQVHSSGHRTQDTL